MLCLKLVLKNSLSSVLTADIGLDIFSSQKMKAMYLSAVFNHKNDDDNGNVMM